MIGHKITVFTPIAYIKLLKKGYVLREKKNHKYRMEKVVYNEY